MTGWTLAGLGALLVLAASAGRADTRVILPPHTSPGQWVFVPLRLEFVAPEARCLRVEPVLHFGQRGAATVERRAWPIIVRTEAGQPTNSWASRVIKVPDLTGEYSVSASVVLLPCEAPSGGPDAPLSTALADLNGQLAVPGTASELTVHTLPGYLAILALIALAVTVPLTVAAFARSRRTFWLGIAIGTVAATLSWRYWLGGQVLFLGLWTTLAAVIARSPCRDAAALRASVVVMVASELYWGSLVNGTFWTAPVISLSVLFALLALARRAIVRPRARAIAAVLFAQFLAILYVCANIYKAFFLDIPAIAVAGDAGQIDRLLDSIAKVALPTHVIAVALPAILVAVIVARRHWHRCDDSQDVVQGLERDQPGP